MKLLDYLNDTGKLLLYPYGTYGNTLYVQFYTDYAGTLQHHAMSEDRVYVDLTEDEVAMIFKEADDRFTNNFEYMKNRFFAGSDIHSRVKKDGDVFLYDCAICDGRGYLVDVSYYEEVMNSYEEEMDEYAKCDMEGDPPNPVDWDQFTSTCWGCDGAKFTPVTVMALDEFKNRKKESGYS